MSVKLREKIEKLNSAQRKRVEDRAAELAAGEMSLRDLSKARKLKLARRGEGSRGHARSHFATRKRG
jgi:hypothetical protein